nr:N-acetylmuramic acid 6-phosphate etherase [Thermoflavimicrobium dichotomicum]
MREELARLTTETRNQRTMQIDRMSTGEILRLMNEEDQKVALSVKEVLPDIEKVVDWTVQALKRGGRIIYVGAGTSGRLGVLDAVECPPTFSTPPEMVVGLIAGGERAFVKAVEGAEDDPSLGEKDLRDIHLSPDDVVIGIAASGRTPYVIGALQYARKVGAKAVALTANKQARLSQFADLAIEVDVGPEVITGSTRLKAGTAHKMILNMISTTTMIRIGKVYENLMVDVSISNEKLKDRAIRIIQTVTQVDTETALRVLEQANHEVKTAIVMIKTESSYEKAKKRLDLADGNVRKAIEG